MVALLVLGKNPSGVPRTDGMVVMEYVINSSRLIGFSNARALGIACRALHSTQYSAHVMALSLATID